jgi:hypothetical protein
MGSVVISGATSGAITLAVPAEAGTRTLTLPAATGTMAITTDTPTALSTASGSAPSYSARAWVNFNGTGTIAIRDSGNVSSVTDAATGNYSVNIAEDMNDGNYAVVAMIGREEAGRSCSNRFDSDNTTGATRVYSYLENGTAVDVSLFSVIILG